MGSEAVISPECNVDTQSLSNACSICTCLVPMLCRNDGRTYLPLPIVASPSHFQQIEDGQRRKPSKLHSTRFAKVARRHKCK